MSKIYIISLSIIIIISIIILLINRYNMYYKKEDLPENEGRKLNLNNDTIDIIELYNKMGIKLPLDIIEELEYNNFSNELDIIAYIENQRIHWKYECMKKFKKDLFN